MVAWVVQAALDAGLDVAVVVHHQEDSVRAALPGIRCVRQEIPRGTGDAVRAAGEILLRDSPILVIPGDTPLIQASTLRGLLQAQGGDLCTLLTTLVADPAAYGRVVRDSSGAVARIVESTEASPSELEIREINAGIYAFDGPWLAREILPHLKPHPPKGEYYLTDAVEAAAGLGRLGACLHPDAESLAGINDRWALACAEDSLQERILRELALSGVTLHRPGTLRVEVGVSVGQDTVVEPGVTLGGSCQIGQDVHIGQGAVIRDSIIGDHTRVLPHCVLQGARVGARCVVGPFARLREGTCLKDSVHVGNFVETKKALLQEGAKANHLSYLGDVRVGARTNIGAGTITCNYDGYRKSHTDIGSDVFIGSDVALVAPVQVGDRAIVGAGSVVVRDVPANALAVARGEQKNSLEVADRLRESFQARAAVAPRAPVKE